jgi:hypothetical protein
VGVNNTTDTRFVATRLVLPMFAELEKEAKNRKVCMSDVIKEALAERYSERCGLGLDRVDKLEKGIENVDAKTEVLASKVEDVVTKVEKESVIKLPDKKDCSNIFGIHSGWLKDFGEYDCPRCQEHYKFFRREIDTGDKTAYCRKCELPMRFMAKLDTDFADGYRRARDLSKKELEKWERKH